MGEIYQTVLLVGTKGSLRINAFFDSGSADNHLRKILSNGVEVERTIGTLKYLGPGISTLANDEEFEEEKMVFKSAEVIGCCSFNPVFLMSDSLVDDMIIGYEAMQQMGLKLDFVADTIRY